VPDNLESGTLAPCAAEKFVLPNGSPACHADPGEGKQNSGHEKDFVD
jgi:hypothetical protein